MVRYFVPTISWQRNKVNINFEVWNEYSISAYVAQCSLGTAAQLQNTGCLYLDLEVDNRRENNVTQIEWIMYKYLCLFEKFEVSQLFVFSKFVCVYASANMDANRMGGGGAFIDEPRKTRITRSRRMEWKFLFEENDRNEPSLTGVIYVNLID